ncbi:MAG: hypothetical protein JWN90_17 [Parcubacteria group bacterium]|nr:hypothetical protein [Parcubacteria group bacterium]
MSGMAYNTHTTMTRSRFLSYLSLGTLSAVGLLVPGATHAAGVVGVFSPIIDQSGICLCTGMAPSWGCVLQTIQNAVNVGISVGVVICVLYMAYAGVLFMMSSANPGLREQGKTRLMNGVIGMVVVLGAWVAVDFVMKALYDPSATFSGHNFGPWNSILASSGDDYCIRPHDPTALTSGSIGIISGVASNPSAGGGGGSGAVTAQASGDCSSTALAKDWGSDQKGKLFSCIVNNESRCQNVATQLTGQGSSAGGRYQVVMSTGQKGAGLNFPACVTVAKAHGFTGTALNCAAAYPGGVSNGSALATQCRAAQLDPTCNTQAAQFLYKSTGIGNWLGKGDIGGKNQSCVDQYGR